MKKYEKKIETFCILKEISAPPLTGNMTESCSTKVILIILKIQNGDPLIPSTAERPDFVSITKELAVSG